MNFEKDLETGYARQIPIDNIRAKSLIKSAKKTINTAKSIDLNEDSANTIIRELYEALRQYCEAISYSKGYKLTTHETITHFIEEKLKEYLISKKFERYRKIRNGINYYGESAGKETAKEALTEIPQIIGKLERHANDIK